MTTHIVPHVRVYWVIFVTLLLLTLITVDVAFYNLGVLNIYVALAVATTKATLVLLYFMHVRYAPPLTAVFAGAGFVFLIILILFTLSDFLTRTWIPGALG
jgi:cytochrome c oxidase subunit 4